MVVLDWECWQREEVVLRQRQASETAELQARASVRSAHCLAQLGFRLLYALCPRTYDAYKVHAGNASLI